ncbi:MAG: aspartate carbamoyltransferase [Candidatus Aenigmarchaeota archaeon]|nr:aspartate carbamoyltransferase [Candidatus Aenigmarchaeota archaeon]
MVKHIVDTRQFKDRRFLEGLFEHAAEMREARFDKGVCHLHDDKVVGGLFYQPSTRTRTTFETAAIRLGAKTVFTENARDFSSAAKGETLEHSLRAIEDCFDVMVIRHYEDGAAKRAAGVLRIPFINAGDGKNQHPTQALLDLFTIKEYFQKIDGLDIGFVGDIAQGRTIKSLAYLLSHLKDNRLYFVSPISLGVPEDMRTYLREKSIQFYETDELDAVISAVDVLYVTRLQFEYVEDEVEKRRLMSEYEKFQITLEKADKMMDGSILMHPLPINTEKSEGRPEIRCEVDEHPRAHYFKQSNNGLYVRMALLDVMLSGEQNPLYSLILDVP